LNSSLNQIDGLVNEQSGLTEEEIVVVEAIKNNIIIQLHRTVNRSIGIIHEH